MAAAPPPSLVDSTRQVLWLTAGAVLVLVAIAVVALVVVSRELEAARDSHAQSQHTRDVIEQVQLVLSTLQDAETGERGFVITGQDTFLEPYRASREQLAGRLDALRRTVIDARSQQIVQQLAAVAREQGEFLDQVVATRRMHGIDAAITLISAGRGKLLMDRIRGLVHQLEAQEKALLEQRLELFNQRSASSERLVQIALCSAILLVLGAGAMLIGHIRRRLRAEGAAREAFVLLRAIIDNLSQGVAAFDAQRRLVMWNTRYLELRGLQAAQLRHAMPVEQVLKLGGALWFTNESGTHDWRVMTPLRDDTAHSFDEEVSRDDGSILQMRGRPMPDGGYVVTFTDVTALKLSETAYREQARRLSSILDNVVDAIVTINESGSIESWSKGAERLFGYTTAEVLRRNVRILMPEPHASAHGDYVRRYVQTGEARIIGRRREVEVLHKDGQRIPVDIAVSEMDVGARRLFIGVIRDISARHEIERLKSGFVSTVSHELRTPLTSISGSLGLLAGGVAGPLPAKALRLIEIAKQNSERLVRLINDILDLERAESGKLEFRLESQPLRPIVQQAVELNRAYAQAFGATLVLEPDSDDAQVLADRDRLLQVLTNIISNAAKFSPRGGTIHVSIRAEADNARISVRDEGPGIAEEFRPRIFQRFAQADSSDSRAKGGTGLGLSIAKTIIERLGGSIGFQSTSGQGATFFVTLPSRREAPPPATIRGARPGRTTVLVCEDDPDVSQILLEILKRHGMDAQAVTTARAAHAALDTLRFDVALIDLHLPDSDGLELVTELRTRESTRALPVIVMTARSHQASDAHQISALELADWLQKPIDPQRLLDSIHRVLPPRERHPRILHVEDDESLTQLVRELLADEAKLVSAHSLATARDCLRDGSYDLVILDIALGDGSGLDLLPLLRHGGAPAPPVILYSATEPSRELSDMVQAALVKSRDSIDQLLRTVRTLARRDLPERRE